MHEILSIVLFVLYQKKKVELSFFSITGTDIALHGDTKTRSTIEKEWRTWNNSTENYLTFFLRVTSWSAFIINKSDSPTQFKKKIKFQFVSFHLHTSNGDEHFQAWIFLPQLERLVIISFKNPIYFIFFGWFLCAWN